MFFTAHHNHLQSTTIRRSAGWTRFLGFSAIAVFVGFLSVPATFDFDDGLSIKNAYASSGKGGGNQGGHGGGNRGGNGGGNRGGNASKSPDSNPTDFASAGSDADRDPLLLLPVEEITMAMFTTRISKRYPANEVTTLENPHTAISFFSEVKDMAGKQISHLWYFEGELKFTARFNIRTDSWRVWSTQLLPVEMTGLWKVEIVDETGKVYETRELDFTPLKGELLASS